MHPPHDYLAKPLADMLTDRRVVVWYDERPVKSARKSLLGAPNPSSGAKKTKKGKANA